MTIVGIQDKKPFMLILKQRQPLGTTPTMGADEAKMTVVAVTIMYVNVGHP